MGRQVNFYMLPKDEEPFAARVDELDGCFIKYQQIEGRKPTCTTLPVAESEPRWNEMCIVPKERLAEVRVWYLNHTVDEENSPVIQFRRSWFLGSKLLYGRIWARNYSAIWSDALQEEVIDYKGIEFERFYNSLARWLRRYCTLEPKVGIWFGPHALEWYRDGGKLGP